ncbi:hypothetical protein J3R30DRAFT_1337027 [Lentinula aciculospora]|uniref:Uncharacterized protein n=1 Tax=Lentinula aciculospora TaxID=153920 RepID=A0A9W9AL41_9AGAR|nr:hypothetical protein J3R30DRAFT_1337027 [Lentinula aciculospora]
MCSFAQKFLILFNSRCNSLWQSIHLIYRSFTHESYSRAMLSLCWITTTAIYLLILFLNILNVSSVSALPAGPITIFTSRNTLPTEASKYIAEPQVLSTRRVATSCQRLTVDQVKKRELYNYFVRLSFRTLTLSVPGWEELEKKAKQRWGKWHEIKTDDPDLASREWAQVCAQPATMSFTGSPQCSPENVTVAGELDGTTGTVATAIAIGNTRVLQVTVSSASSIFSSGTLMTSISAPGIIDGISSATFSLDITNSETSSASRTYSDMTTMTLTMSSAEGKTCNVMATVKSCTVRGTGEVKLVATGSQSLKSWTTSFA